MRLILHYVWNIFLWFIVTFLLENLVYIAARKRIPDKMLAFRLCFFAYVLSICSQTVFPRIDYGILSSGKLYIEFLPQSGNESNLNLLPLRTIWTYLAGNTAGIADSDQASITILNLLGNIGMYIPIGFLLPVVSNRCYHVGRILFYSAVGSITLEVIQFFIGRSADIDDVILHLIGAWIGYQLWWQIIAYTENKKPPKAEQREFHGKRA